MVPLLTAINHLKKNTTIETDQYLAISLEEKQNKTKQSKLWIVLHRLPYKAQSAQSDIQGHQDPSPPSQSHLSVLVHNAFVTSKYLLFLHN